MKRAFALLAMLPLAAWAGPQPLAMATLLPPQPTTRDFVHLRLQFHGCGISEWRARIDAAARVVRYYVIAEDACSQEQDHVTTTPVGFLAAGPWHLESWGCENGHFDNPDLFCAPNDLPAVAFTVTRAGKARPIPAGSAAAAWMTIAVLAGLAWRRLRVRR